MKNLLKWALPLVLLTACTQPPQPLTEEEMRANWKEMNASKQETIAQFNNDKFGMFIHWGPYAIPAGEWEGKRMEEMRRPHVAEWIQYSAEISRKEYTKLATRFNPTNFDADAIAALAKAAGMKYLVITSKHHDGFAMYDSECSEWDIMDASPFHRDVVQELYDACKKYDIDFGIYYSHNIDWMDGHDCQYSVIKEMGLLPKENQIFGMNLWDPSPNTFDEYLENKAFPQVDELMTKFPDMKQVWYDMSHFMTTEQSYDFYKAVYKHQPQIIINERVGNDFGDFDIPGDNKIPADPDAITKPWQTVGTLNNSWGFKHYDNDWKSVKELIFWLTEIVSKGGNYMLNIGPDGMGNVPQMCTDNLLELGKWIDINGEAIYGTSRWIKSQEGPTTVVIKGTNHRKKGKGAIQFTSEDFWFTQKDNMVYAIAIEYPEDGKVIIESFGGDFDGKVRAVELLGSTSDVVFQQTETGLAIELGDTIPNPNGYALKITID